MEIFPAIDLRYGKVVRLTQGDYDNMTVFSEDPLEIAKNFESCGSRNLHTVDLDGAKDGKLCNFDVIVNIKTNTKLFLQVGGGIRDMSRIESYVNAGVDRVILGSVAVESPDFVGEAVRHFGDKIAIGVDAANEKVAIHGWKTVTDVDSVEFCRLMHDKYGVKTIIYTDISKDGMLSGTNTDIYRKLSGIEGLNIVASGGITYEHELVTLADMGIYGAIIGKALYTGKIDLANAIRTADIRR